MTPSMTCDRLFVYGTLRNDPNHEMHRTLLQNSTYLGKARICGELFNLGDFPGVVLDEKSKELVIGELYGLTNDIAESLRALDDYEECGPNCPEPHLYVRQLTEALLADNTKTNAWVYVLRSLPAQAVRIPSGDYMAWKRRSANNSLLARS